MKQRKLTLLLLALIALSLLPARVSATEAHPAVSNTNFIIYAERSGSGEGVPSSVFPTTFHVMYTGEAEHEVNGFWGPFEDPGSYRYEVVSREWSFVIEPRQIYESQQSRFLLTYFASVSAIPYATKEWWGWFREKIKVVVSASIYVRIDRAPRDPMTINLADIIGSHAIPVRYDVVVQRVQPSYSMFTVSGEVDLLTSALLKFFRLSLHSVGVEVKGGSGFGRFNESGFIMVSPSGDITVSLCLDRPPYVPPGEPPLVFEGKLLYRAQFQVAETNIRLDSARSPCGTFTLRNVSLIPGSYRGNNSMALTLKSGAFEVTLRAEADVLGALVAASTPFVLAKPEYDESTKTYTWVIETQIPVNVISHGGGAGSVRAEGIVTLGGANINVACGWIQFTSSGLYTCTVRSPTPRYDPSMTYSGTARITVSVESSNRRHSDLATTGLILLTHTSIQFVVSTMYRYLVTALLSLLLAFVVLQVVQVIVGMMGVQPFFNAIPTILTLSALVVIVMGLPYLYTALFSVMCTISADPNLSEFARGMGCPISVFGASPEDAIARLFSYYDRLITRVRADYMVWVKGALDEFLGRLNELFIGATVLFGIALILMLSMNSPVVGSIASTMITFGFSIIAILASLAPTISIVLVFVSLVEVLVTVATVALLALIPLGALLMLAPSSTIQVYGENILGAGFFFLLVSPGVAPAVYGLYMQVLKVLEESVLLVRREVIALTIPLFRAVTPPLDLVMKLSGYIALSSIVLGMVVLIHVYLLMRTGIMSGIGESLARILRR